LLQNNYCRIIPGRAGFLKKGFPICASAGKWGHDFVCWNDSRRAAGDGF
jgi:hypothetical protein